MEKTIKLLYEEYSQMEETIRKQNKALRTAINNEGNLIIDKRELRHITDDFVFEMPKIEGPTKGLMEHYKIEFDRLYKTITDLEKEYKEEVLLARQNKDDLDDKLKKQEIRYTWDFWIACVFIFTVGLVIGLYS